MGRGYAAVGLHQPKFSVNIGSVLRAAACFDVACVAYTGHRFERSKAPSDTPKAWRNKPLFHVENLGDVIPYACVPVAVELIAGATSLVDYEHPARAFYIFGPEDGSLGGSITEWCRDVVSIPTDYCLNLAMTVNVVLYDRLAKALRQKHEAAA